MIGASLRFPPGTGRYRVPADFALRKATIWGPRLEYILRNAVLALLEAPDATLIQSALPIRRASRRQESRRNLATLNAICECDTHSLMRLLTDKPFRQRLLTHVTDPVVRAFWETEFGPWPPKFKAEAIAPIQNKIGQFLSNPLMRSIVGQNRGSGTFFGRRFTSSWKISRRKVSQTPGSSICDR